MLLLNKENINYNISLFKSADSPSPKTGTYDQDLWEEATLDDVKSGNYETS